MQNRYSSHSQQNGQIFTIFHKVNCKSDFVIYLLECRRFPIQYVSKAETDFNSRLNKHCNDVYKADAIQTSSHFVLKNHIFNRDASSIRIEQIWKNTLRNRPIEHETRNFKTLRSSSRTEHSDQSNPLPSYANCNFLQCTLMNQIHRCLRNTWRQFFAIMFCYTFLNKNIPVKTPHGVVESNELV